MTQRERIIAALRDGPKTIEDIPRSWWKRHAIAKILERMEREGVIIARGFAGDRRFWLVRR